MRAMFDAFFHSVGRFVMKPELSVSTRQVFQDFGVACLLAALIGAAVGVAAAAFVAFVSSVG
jgi:hypothetical protein